MTDGFRVLMQRLIIVLDLLYDATKCENDIWILISDLVEEMQHYANQSLCACTCEKQSGTPSSCQTKQENVYLQ